MSSYSRFPIVQHIPLDQLKDSPFQPRVNYGNIEELAESIKSIKLREPILVRPIEGGYEIVHGHRRKRALQHLGATMTRCYVQKMSDKMAIEIALNQNVQRKNLNPIEEGVAFKEYMKMFGVSQRVLARKIGKTQPYINYRIRLLDLPKEIQDKISSGEMIFSNVRELLTIIDRRSDVIGIVRKIEEGELEGTIQVRDAVEAVKIGADIEEAVELAKYQEFKREMAKKIAKGGKSIKEVLKEIQSRQIGSEVIRGAIEQSNLNIVKEMLSRGLLVCPKCGKSHLNWSCCGGVLA